MQMCFDHLAGATLTPLKLITNFTEAQKEYEVYLNDDFTVSLFRIVSSMDSGALEYIDEINSKFPLPILGNLNDYKSYNERLQSYGKTPMPI
jgi:hypothetical protein